MAEWVPPPPPPPPFGSGNTPFSNTIVPAQRQRSTYVVQVPKDQIYRVPPPENADYVQRYGNSQSDKGTCTTCISRRCTLLLIALLLLVVVCTGLYLVIRPKPPSFSISHVLVKNLNTNTTLGHHRRRLPKPTYEITLQSDNKNLVLGTSYQEGGTATLSYKNEKLAAGDTPGLYLDHGDSKELHLVLHGGSAMLPHEIKKSVNSGKGAKAKVRLALEIRLPTKLVLGTLKVAAMEVTVNCNLKVSTLAKGTRVEDQECHTRLSS